MTSNSELIVAKNTLLRKILSAFHNADDDANDAGEEKAVKDVKTVLEENSELLKSI